MSESNPKKGTNISTNEINVSDDATDLLGQSGLRVGSLLRAWADVSRINYLSSKPLDIIARSQSIRRRSIGLPVKEYSIECLVPTPLRNKSIEDLFAEVFPVKVTPLLNEDQLWGCFYTFPELYNDVYSPVVRIRAVEDVPELEEGVLTRDLVTACLTYLKRTPILGDYVYIKLDLGSKLLSNIDVLKHYKFLVYLDLSRNLLTDLKVLSHLLYLQYLSVAYNRLQTVLEYDTPQWFLTEVHYKFNAVKRIPDLCLFWSITILDLSHNNIKGISGLESLKYLRRLDLSFNHIQRLENLNHLRLVWLDVSYNNISSFEFGPHAGLWTLLHLEYLNLNENNLTSMKMFSGCVRLRELHARNNSLSMLLELSVYMRGLRRLAALDLRANPVCAARGYRPVVCHTFPLLLSLDDRELDPVEQRTCKMSLLPDIHSHSTRRLLRLLYVEQLSRARVSPHTAPADTTEVPLVAVVGHQAVGKGSLVRRLAHECSDHVSLAALHTTAAHHSSGHYIQVTRKQFDDMLLRGELLTYTEMGGESYGLSREQSFVTDGKVRLASMDLASALMLQLRGRRPYLILATCSDKVQLLRNQQMRKTHNEQRVSTEPMGRSTLQVLVSGRIVITGILNEILMCLPEDKERSEFILGSECSLMMDGDTRRAVTEYARGVDALNANTSSVSSLVEASEESPREPSWCSLYKGSQATADYTSVIGRNSDPDRKLKKSASAVDRNKEKHETLNRPRSVDFTRYTSSTWKGMSTVPDSSKSSKSVTFMSTDQHSPTGMFIEPTPQASGDKSGMARSVSVRGARLDSDEDHLWTTFLTDTCLSDDRTQANLHPEAKVNDPNLMLQQMGLHQPQLGCESQSTTVRDDYEAIHRRCPGLFWDTISMDNPNEAYSKMKGILRDIVNSQHKLKPMFDIDFTSLQYYPTVQKRLEAFHQEIAPQRLFH